MTQTTDATCELSMTRVFRAPKDLILKVWSDPVALSNWWGPFGFSTTTHSLDFRPGGVWDFVMHGPDGTDYPNVIQYVETGPDRIVYDHGSKVGEFDFHVVVSLDEATPGQTNMDFRMIFPTPEERTRIVDTYGAEKGLVETTTRLDTLLADTQLAENPFKLTISLPSDTEIRMVRSFRAPKQLVYEAFTKAEHVQRWQGPDRMKYIECEFDAQVGGKWHTAVQDTDGAIYRFHGEFLEVDAPDRVVSTFEMVGMPGGENKNTTFFEEVGGLTRVTIISSFASKEARDGMLQSGMEGGMTEGYNRLERLFESGSISAN